MKKDAVSSFEVRVESANFSSKKDCMEVIRQLADEDESFENVVFELGCSVLSKELYKKHKEKYFKEANGFETT